jgi:hypothetical protein
MTNIVQPTQNPADNDRYIRGSAKLKEIDGHAGGNR